MHDQRYAQDILDHRHIKSLTPFAPRRAFLQGLTTCSVEIYLFDI